jgi:hypothetical protein
LSPGMTISTPSGSVTVPARDTHAGAGEWASRRLGGSWDAAGDSWQTGQLFPIWVDCENPSRPLLPPRQNTCGPAGERTRDVGCAEEELRLVVREEGGVAPALLLAERVDLALELAVGLDAAGLADDLRQVCAGTQAA